MASVGTWVQRAPGPWGRLFLQPLAVIPVVLRGAGRGAEPCQLLWHKPGVHLRGVCARGLGGIWSFLQAAEHEVLQGGLPPRCLPGQARQGAPAPSVGLELGTPFSKAGGVGRGGEKQGAFPRASPPLKSPAGIPPAIACRLGSCTQAAGSWGAGKFVCKWVSGVCTQQLPAPLHRAAKGRRAGRDFCALWVCCAAPRLCQLGEPGPGRLANRARGFSPPPAPLPPSSLRQLLNTATCSESEDLLSWLLKSTISEPALWDAQGRDQSFPGNCSM